MTAEQDAYQKKLRAANNPLFHVTDDTLAVFVACMVRRKLQYPPPTPEDLAAFLGISVDSLNQRLSKLRRHRLLTDSLTPSDRGHAYFRAFGIKAVNLEG